MIDFKNNKIKIDLIIFLSYMFLTLVMTYPLIFSIGSSVPDNKGDTLHNAWILSWTVHSLFKDPSNLFNSNIYYPLNNTFSFSEVQLTNSILAMPILILSDNPILAHNFVLLLSFILSGFGMYYLVRYLTDDYLAGFISGIIFAFFPFKFAQLPHLQLLSTQWIPFSLLFLHKFFDTKSRKNLILFFFFFSLQVITIGYLTLFLLSAVLIYLIYLLIFKKQVLIEGLVGNLSLITALLTSLVLISLFFYLPYIYSSLYGYNRSFDAITWYGADIINYFSVPSLNNLYGDVLYKNAGHEGITALFPGVISIILMLFGFIKFFNVNSGVNRFCAFFNPKKDAFFYILLMFFGFSMSLGPSIHVMGKTILPGPYSLFYFLPGFNGIRYIPAFIILVMVGISVFSGFGLNYLFKKMENIKDIYKKAFFAFLTVGLLIEFISIPIPTPYVATGDKIPEVYKWLSNDTRDYAILEIPSPREIKSDYLWDQFDYMYFSTYHWKKLVTGATGYFPLYYNHVLEEIRDFPSNRSISLLQVIGVKYVIVHTDRLPLITSEKIISDASKSKDLSLVKRFDFDYVYEISPRERDVSCLYAEHNVPTKIDNDRQSIGLVIKNNCDDLFIFLPDDRITNKAYLYNQYINKQIYINYVSLHQESVIIDKKHPITVPISINMRDIPKGDYVLKLESMGDLLNISTAHKISIPPKIPDSKNPQKLNAVFLDYIIPEKVTPNQKFYIYAKVFNNGDTIWLRDTPDENPPGKGEVRPVVSGWYDSKGVMVKSENGMPIQPRGKLPIDVFPNQTVYISIGAVAPSKEGEYIVKIDLVDELVTWFFEKGSVPISVKILVSDS